MITASELAGFIAAHAILCVSDADTLTPMLAFTTDDGKRHLERLFVQAGEEETVKIARQKLEADPLSANDGVLAFDGRINLDTGKQDAVILEMRSYAFPWAKATIAIPYTPRSSGKFRVHKPKLLIWKECEDFDIDTAFEAFFRGVDTHAEGSKVWNAALDQSR